MPTVAERLAAVERGLLDVTRRLDELHSDVHSGGSVPWPQSIRGRLHEMRSALEAADKLADVARELADQRAKEKRSRLTRWQWVYLAVCATVAAAAPYVLILIH